MRIDDKSGWGVRLCCDYCEYDTEDPKAFRDHMLWTHRGWPNNEAEARRGLDAFREYHEKRIAKRNEDDRIYEEQRRQQRIAQAADAPRIVQNLPRPIPIELPVSPPIEPLTPGFCDQCGEELFDEPKRFCSEKCRIAYLAREGSK